MPSKHNLSEGSLLVIMRGGDYKDPVFQVLGAKKITSSSAGKDRYRILLSDGRHSISFAMLTTNANDNSEAECLKTFCVLKITKFITSAVNASKGDQRVLLIMDKELVASAEEVGDKIGSPTQLTDAEINDTSGTSSQAASNRSSSFVPKVTAPNGQASMNLASGEPNLAGQIIHPIGSLTPYQNKWVIKVRVTNKSAIRTWSNSRGEGKLFSFELVDESGEIRATAFKNEVDKFFDQIQVDKVYYITKCQLKPANKQFSTVKNDYEMTLTPDTVIQECQDADLSSIPQTKYDFVSIDKIAAVEPNTMVDVIGVIKSVGDLQTFQARSTGKELKKKEVTLVDQSKSAIALTLWGSEAESFEVTGNPVVVIKGVRVSEFGGGKNLSTVSSTNLKINPEMRECYRLRSWYDNEGENLDMTNLSARTGSGNFNSPWISFKEAQDQNLGNAERGDYYQTMCTVLLIRSENAMYKACPSPDCNKKVVDLENGMYRCEKCNREFPNFKYRLLASMNVGDWSGNQWVSMFSSEVEKVLGKTAQEVGDEIEQNHEAMVGIVDKVHFKQFIMKFRAKMETYNDESRLKTVCVKVDPINYEEYNAHLIEDIERMIS